MSTYQHVFYASVAVAMLITLVVVAIYALRRPPHFHRGRIKIGKCKLSWIGCGQCGQGVLYWHKPDTNASYGIPCGHRVDMNGGPEVTGWNAICDASRMQPIRRTLNGVTTVTTALRPKDPA